MSSNDEMVSQFIAFTGSSDTERASMYLEMSGGNLETAVGLYMEHQAGGGGGAGAAASSSSPTGATAGLGGLGGMGGAGGADDVRAPDVTRTMRLMDDGPRGLMGNSYGVMNHLVQQQLATSAFARDVVNLAADEDDHDHDDQMDDADDDDDSEYNGGNSESDSTGEKGTSRKKSSSASGKTAGGASREGSGLADMFAPPRHLICNAGGFEGARANAKDSRRWLLVNLQRDNEFSCHALNRDVWRDELVENLIGEGFVFWQEMDLSPEGSIYAQRYNVYDYPHVGIIDPRTRRLMWKKEGWTQQNPLTAERFAEIAMDFCSRHSFDRPPQAPRPPGGGGTAAAPKASGRPAKRPMHEMTEDEQLQAAMRASLEDSNGGGGGGDTAVEYEIDDSDDDGDDVVVVDPNKQEEDSKPKAIEKKAAPPQPQAPASMLDELKSFDIGAEPEKGARIQLRMPNGKRKIRKFDPSQSVKFVYAFVAQENPDGKEFVLKSGFPPKDLIGDIDNSIQECSLAGEAITVRWK